MHKCFTSATFVKKIIVALYASTAMLATAADEEFDAEEYFKKGMEERAAEKPYSAIESFQTILSNEPSLHRARLELAVAYLQTLQFEEAQAEAQRVLDDPNTPANVKIAILAFLAQVKNDSEGLLPGHTSKTTISAGLLYDSNVNVGPASDVININGIQQLQLSPESMPIEDSAVVVAAAFDHSYRTSKKLRMGEKTGLLLWQSGASIYERSYDTNDEFNLGVITLRTGPSIITNGNFRGNVALQLDHIRLDDSVLANYVSLLPTATWSLNDSFELTTSLEISKRDFTQIDDQLRDATYYSAGVSLGRGYLNNAVAVQGGVKIFTSEADSDRFSYNGNEVFIGAVWQFKPEAFTFVRFSENNSDYDGLEPVFNIARDERERRAQIGLTYNFESNLSLSGVLFRTEVDSNVDTFTYDRDQFSLNISKSF